MSSRPWYSFYPADYDRDTAHLSLLEHGAYRRLIDHYYSVGSMLPLLLERCCRLVRAHSSDECQAVETVLGEFFERRAGGFYHKRIEQELDKAKKLSEKCSKAGIASATKRQQDRQHRANKAATRHSTRPPTCEQPSQSQSQKKKEATREVSNGGREYSLPPASGPDDASPFGDVALAL